MLALIVAGTYGITITPDLLRKDFSSLIAAESEKTEILKKQYEDDLAAKKATFEEELAAIDVQLLRRNATANYKAILESRRSFDSRFALSLREEAQLQMRNLSSDSTESFHDMIRSLAKKASPSGADISVYESLEGIALHIDFDMSSMTSGEDGTRTKHKTKDALRKEVVSLISRVTNDIFQFSKDLHVRSIFVGCRHGVITSDPDGSTDQENLLLYKISIQESEMPELTNDPYLDTYSTTDFFTVDEDNFDEIEIQLGQK